MRIAIFLSLFFSTFFCLAQDNISLKKYCVDKSTDFGDLNVNIKFIYLKSPDEITEEDIIDNQLAYDEPGIFIGEKPKNFNGIVLGIHGGFTTKFGSRKIIEDGVYKYFYDKGYAVAFIASSAFLGDYYNAYITSVGVDVVTKYFGVEKMSLAGFSNGGSILEISNICFDTVNKVDKNYALGSPFLGSELADLVSAFPDFAQYTTMFFQGAFTQAARLEELPFFINVLDTDSYYFLTTYYKKTIFRPYIDSHKDNRPETYYMVRSGNFIDFSNTDIVNLILSSSMLMTGTLMSFLTVGELENNPFGKNDGVTALYSSERPGSIVFDEFSDVRKHHFNLCDADGSIFAREILHEVIQKSNSTAISKNINSKYKRKDNNSRNLFFQSDYQISSMGSFRLDKNFNPVNSTLYVVNQNVTDSINALINKASDTRNFRMIKNKEAFSDKLKDILFREVEIPNKINKKNNFRLSEIENSESFTLSFLKQNDAILELKVDYSQSAFDYNQNPYPVLLLDVKSENSIVKNPLNIFAIANRVADLDGKKSSDETYTLEFVYNPEKGIYEAQTLNQPYGLYSLKIRVNNQDIQRDLIGGYTVGSLFETVNIDDSLPESKQLIYIDTSKKIITLQVNDKSNLNEGLLKFYDTNGKYLGLVDYNKSNYKNNTISIDYSNSNILFLKDNFYFVVAEYNGKKEPKKVLVK